jgi:hypothetical protein
MRVASLAVLLALAAPAAVAQTAARSHVMADGGVMVAMGERVVLRLAADGKATLVSAGPAALADAAPPKPGSGANPVQDADNAITLVLGEQGSGVLLKVQSGLSRAFDYDADLLVAKAGGWTAEPTSVCTVLPLLAGYESWPGRHADAIVVRNFRLRETNAVTCPQPKRPVRSLTPA